MFSHEKDPTVGWFGWNWKTAIGVVYFSTKKRGDVLERWLDDGWVIHLPGLLGIMNLFMGMPGFIKQNFMGWEHGMLFFIQTKKHATLQQSIFNLPGILASSLGYQRWCDTNSSLVWQAAGRKRMGSPNGLGRFLTMKALHGRRSDPVPVCSLLILLGI